MERLPDLIGGTTPARDWGYSSSSALGLTRSVRTKRVLANGRFRAPSPCLRVLDFGYRDAAEDVWLIGSQLGPALAISGVRDASETPIETAEYETSVLNSCELGSLQARTAQRGSSERHPSNLP